ncbi:hypothetical protein F5Y16DRAFT_355665 [Xylariaceae sp. FL0255]|nr:hypothetical protein F5Y16DRAFT_355665 [Xylariaceae sp. FL0255]
MATERASTSTQPGSNLAPQKYEQIDIWRREVAATDPLCACSGAAIKSAGAECEDDHPQNRSIQGPPVKVWRSPTKRKDVVSSVTPVVADSDDDKNTKDETPDKAHCQDPSHHELDQGKEPGELCTSTGLAEQSLKAIAESWRHQPREGDCHMCAAPTDGIAYEELEDGSGLVRRSQSSGSFLLANGNGPAQPKKKKKKKSKKTLLKTMSQVFQWGHKKGGLTTAQQLQPDIGSPEKDALKPDRQTEMYSNLRHNGANDDCETNESPSEDSARKKPRLTIQRSAARLLRAKQLLDQQSKKHPEGGAGSGAAGQDRQ